MGKQDKALWCRLDLVAKNRLRIILGFCALAFATAHCGTASAEGGVKIGILYEAHPADQPWSASIYDAAQKLAKSDPSIKLFQSYDAFDPTAAEPVARQMIQMGVTVLDMHSFALNDVAHTLSKEYPGVVMSVSSFSPAVQPNLNVGTASYLQMGYSDCWLLARVSKSHKIGFVGAMPLPYEKELLAGCKAGAAAAYPGTLVLSAYSNSFEDQQATREQSQALLDRGADGLFPSSATQDSLGGFQLCEQAHIPCVGWASQIRRYAPTYGIGSAVVDWSVFLKNLVGEAGSPHMTAKTFDATFSNGGLVAQPFIASDSTIVPVSVQEGYAAVVSDLSSGKISLPASGAHPGYP